MFHNRITCFPQFVKKVFYDHDISKLNPGINKTQTHILMCVKENGDRSMSEISQMTGLEKSSFTRSVDCLVRNGFITRSALEHDRRKIRLLLTDKGTKAATRIINNFNSYLGSLVTDFSEKDKREFLKSLDTVSKYMIKILERNT